MSTIEKVKNTANNPMLIRVGQILLNGYLIAVHKIDPHSTSANVHTRYADTISILSLSVRRDFNFLNLQV